MAEAARSAMLKRLSPSARFDRGLELANHMVEACLRDLDIPEDCTDEELRRRRFRALRQKGA